MFGLALAGAALAASASEEHANLKFSFAVPHIASLEKFEQKLGRFSPSGHTTHAAVVFVDMYAPWCPHCQRFAPNYAGAAELFIDNHNADFYAVNCNKVYEICRANAVQGYPTLKAFYNEGNPEKKGDFSKSGIKFKGRHTVEGVVGWVMEMLTSHNLSTKMKPSSAGVSGRIHAQLAKSTAVKVMQVNIQDLAACIHFMLQEMFAKPMSATQEKELPR
jgi:thiol-disulfide isomerase/thioredoxin